MNLELILMKGFDWSGLLAQNLQPPIHPLVISSTDTSNFDKYVDNEKDEAKHCFPYSY